MRLSMILMPYAGITFLVLVILNLFNRQNRPVPFQGSMIALSAVIINWLFYIFGVYILLPVQVADVLFTFGWVVLLTLAAFWAVKEFRNNRLFAMLLGALTLFSTLFVILLHGIAKM